MKDRCTLYGDSVLGFRKMLMCLMVVILSVFPVFQEPNALSVAIFVQGVSNIDNFWDFLKERDICKPLRSAIKVLIFLSVLAIIIALLNFMENIFSASYGGIIKVIALVAVGFPIVVLWADSHMSAKVEEIGGDKENV